MKRVQTNFTKIFFLKILIFFCCAKISSQCITSFPYNEGFETSPSWTISGPNSDWMWGAPAHPTINSAGGGLKSWCVGSLSGTFYNNAEQAAIVSPCFDFSNLNYPWISFKIFWECEFNYDGLVLQYSTNNGVTWNNVGAYGDPNDCNTANWFNHNNISKLTSIATRHGWSGRIGASAAGCSGGNGSGGWVVAKHCLTGLANLSNVHFRFLFGSGTTCNNFDGIALDDIVISNGISNVGNYNFICGGGGSYNFNAIAPSCPVPGTYGWNFGDAASGPSNVSAVQNPSHTFSAPGIYSVTLIVKGGQCNPPDTITQTIIVPNVSNPIVQNISCFGANNGSASVSVAPSAGCTYTWFPSGGNSSSVNNLSAGVYTVQINDPNNCSYTKTLSVTEPSQLNINLITQNASCGSSTGSATVIANGGTGGYTYSWLPSSSTSSINTNLNIGAYNLSVSDANNCTVSQTFSITQIPGLQLSVNSLTLCNNQPGIFTATVSGGTSPYSYNWNGTVTVSNTLPVVGGITESFPLLVTDKNGCISNPDTAKLYAITPLVINTIPIDSVCPGSPAILTVNANGGNGIYNYVWQPGAMSGASVSISPTPFQIYTVTVTDGCSASKTATTTVFFYNVPTSSLTTSNTQGCQPLCVNFSDLTLNNSGTVKSWSWDFGDSTTSSSSSPEHCYLKSGVFGVKLNFITKQGCKGSQTISNYIHVFPKPVADFSANTYETDVYNPTVNFINQSVGNTASNWFFGGEATSNYNSPSYTFLGTGHYRVLLAVVNNFGCLDTISKDIYVKPDFTFYAPNAFTPNEDGLNDRFIPKGAGWDPDKYQLFIYDRWGEKIFSTNNPTEGWEGKVKGRGEIVENGIYVWKVILHDIFEEKHEFAGHVTLNK